MLKLFDKAKNLNLEKVGLALSGLDSEIIAHSLHKLKIPAEFFFLNVVGANDNQISDVKKVAKKYDTKLNIIRILQEDLIDNLIYESFSVLPVIFPGYVTNTLIIKYIPDDFYIIIGEGDLEKTGIEKYGSIFKEAVPVFDPNFYYIPMHLSEIMYSKCLDFYNKKGEANFYSYNFNTWFHILRDSRLITNRKFFYDPKSELLFNDCRNFIFQKKTDTFNNNPPSNLEKTIITRLLKQTSASWKWYIGDVVAISKDLIYA